MISQFLLCCKKDSNSMNNCNSRFFYDGIGNEISVKEIFNKGVISFYDTLSIDTIIKLLKPYKSIHLTGNVRASHIIVSMDVRSCSEADLLFSNIEKDTRVSNCNKFLFSSTGDSIGLYDIFNCKLKNDTLLDHLNELLIKTNTKIIGFDNTLRFYYIRADKNSEGDALAIANKFYESGYFEWSQPDFIMKIVFSK